MAFPVQYIKEILERDGILSSGSGTHRQLTRAKFEQSKLRGDILEVYEDLGGKTALPPFEARPFDLEFMTKVVLFDDEPWFNRYRMITLRSEIYEKSKLPVQTYRKWCRNEEKECLKGGLSPNVWTNREAESYFGKSEDPGDFGLNGSAGWKLKAWKDYLADISGKLGHYEVVRIPIYEEIMIEGKLKRFKDFLLYRKPEDEKYIASFMRRKLGMEIIIDPFGEEYRKPTT